MKKSKLKMIGVVSFIIFCLNCEISMGVDKSIYYNIWETKKSPINIILSISNENEIMLTINNKRINNLKVDYLYGDSAVFPFLYIYSYKNIESESKKYFLEEQYLYLIIGVDGEETAKSKYILRGYYVNSKVRDDHYGSEKIMSYPIELYARN